MTEHADQNAKAAPESDDALLRRVGYGLVWGFVAAGLLGYLLISLVTPDQGQAGRIGLAMYLAFWSGPFIGLSAAVGYHELKKHHPVEDHLPTTAAEDQTAGGRMDVAAAA